MKFKFDITLNDNDYIDYNMFHMTRSHYGKKQVNGIRIIMAVIMSVYMLITLVGGGFSKEAVIDCIPTAILMIVLMFILKKFYGVTIKNHIKSMKKTGKMAYSPESVMEFYDDRFVEITPDEKNERKYSTIERISIVENKAVYIHVNNIMSYILPMNCFESLEQYYFFMSFIKTKCPTIDSYK